MGHDAACNPVSCKSMLLHVIEYQNCKQFYGQYRKSGISRMDTDTSLQKIMGLELDLDETLAVN
jgi:hypothetical protein